jgi:hypothetical protein
MLYAVFQNLEKAGKVYKLKPEASNIFKPKAGKLGAIGVLKMKAGMAYVYDDLKKAKVHAGLFEFGVGCGG